MSLHHQIQTYLDHLITTGRETGLQVTAYHHGNLLTDAVAGHADHQGRAVTPDTPFFAFSIGKGLTGAAIHLLADRGHLDDDLRLADVWPEFAQHGKDTITLRHVLTHSAGLPTVPADTTAEHLADWNHMCDLLADAQPIWEPGTRHGYHAWTYGYLAGETVRRATGRTLSDILDTDIATPLGVPGELRFGVPDSDLPRLAVLEDHGWTAAFTQLATHAPNVGAAAPPGVRPDATLGNQPTIQRADIPAVGTVTARAAARLYSALLTGELISPDRLKTATTTAVTGPDWTFGGPTAFTLGFGVIDDTWIGYDGSGGSIAAMAPAHGIALAATKNALSYGDDDPMDTIRRMVLDAVTG
ncbi:MAG: beta-lactamase family protein [Hamadaea sp.]|nr:beta-lactamase family protein [Hamadaea sp.]NUR51873.1 beta-lactamase family protein [Hamadaea sp.]NUT05659.1 beta-lactamase family protein [Hamadaea sp.]